MKTRDSASKSGTDGNPYRTCWLLSSSDDWSCGSSDSDFQPSSGWESKDDSTSSSFDEDVMDDWLALDDYSESESEIAGTSRLESGCGRMKAQARVPQTFQVCTAV